MKKLQVKFKPNVQSGFTLIELLIVIFIASMVTGVALLSFTHNEKREMKAFASNMMEMLHLAQDRALLENKVIGLVLNKREFYFVHLEHVQQAKTLVWQEIKDHNLARQRLPNNVELSVRVANKKLDLDMDGESGEEGDNNGSHHSAIDPHILIFTNRDMTPFTIYIQKTGDKPYCAIFAEANGSLINKILG